MAETKHTEGRWEAWKLPIGDGWGVLAKGAKRPRIDDQGLGMSKADAHLCAAAPDLLEALKIAQAHAPCDLYAAAIARATGETR